MAFLCFPGRGTRGNQESKSVWVVSRKTPTGISGITMTRIYGTRLIQ